MATFRKKLTTVSSTCTALGVNAIVAAPAAGQRHVIKTLQIQLGIAGAQTVLVKSGTTQLWNFTGADLGVGIMLDFESSDELPCGTAEAINLDLTAATVVRYVVRYYTEAT